MVLQEFLSFIFGWKIFGKLSGQITDESGSTNSSDSTNSLDFVKQFDGLAQKLLQESKKGEKASYAFLDFSADNQNSSVEKYITDAFTESVFNTGKVKIIERDNLEKILNEQKLQSSGLVNESRRQISVTLTALNMSAMEQSRKSKTVTQPTHSL